MHNYNKAQKLLKSNNYIIDHNKILDVQLSLKKEKNKIYVLSTLPLITIDYNYEKTIEILKNKLKNNFIEFNN